MNENLQESSLAASFNIAKQQYSEMKRLQTSQGPRTVKYVGQNQLQIKKEEIDQKYIQ